MEFVYHGHRHAAPLFFALEEYRPAYLEIESSIDSITDDMIVEEFESEKREAKSISQAINRLIKKEMIKRGWNEESYIFADEEYGPQAKGTWRLDFAKEPLSVEVAFNHRSDISWNLIKPTLASELNHVNKAIQTTGGVIITATSAMKSAGGFDNACGTFEDYVSYLKPLYGLLPAPLLIIGLRPPQTFRIDVEPVKPGESKKRGIVRKFALKNGDTYICPDCGSVINYGTNVCECGRRLAYRLVEVNH